MIIAGIEFPDKCPEDCRLKGDLKFFSQNSLCTRCPVFTCSGEDALIRAGSYREDWAMEWKRFFDGEVDYPILYFRMRERTNET